jgi:hypothetical protein
MTDDITHTTPTEKILQDIAALPTYTAADGQQAIVVGTPRPNNKGMQMDHYWTDNLSGWVEANINWLHQRNAAGAHIYYSTGAFAPTRGPLTVSSGRSKGNACAQRSLFLDIDAKEQLIPTVDACAHGLKNFLKASGLPTPTIINTGNGLHAYWVCDDIIEMDTWEVMSAVLFNAAAHFGLKCDSSVTGDSARILRLPGFANAKTTPAPVVEVLHNAGTHILESLGEALTPYIALDTVKTARNSNRSAKAAHTASQSGSLFAGIDLAGAMGEAGAALGSTMTTAGGYSGVQSFDTFKERTENGTGCHIIHWATRPENHPKVGYALWHGVMSIAARTDKAEEAVTWAGGEHENFSVRESLYKGLHFEGPRTCATLRTDATASDCPPNLCSGCRYNNIRIGSPLMLADPQFKPPADPAPAAAARAVLNERMLDESDAATVRLNVVGGSDEGIDDADAQFDVTTNATTVVVTPETIARTETPYAWGHSISYDRHGVTLPIALQHMGMYKHPHLTIGRPRQIHIDWIKEHLVPVLMAACGRKRDTVVAAVSAQECEAFITSIELDVVLLAAFRDAFVSPTTAGGGKKTAWLLCTHKFEMNAQGHVVPLMQTHAGVDMFYRAGRLDALIFEGVLIRKQKADAALAAFHGAEGSVEHHILASTATQATKAYDKAREALKVPDLMAIIEEKLHETRIGGRLVVTSDYTSSAMQVWRPMPQSVVDAYPDMGIPVAEAVYTKQGGINPTSDPVVYDIGFQGMNRIPARVRPSQDVIDAVWTDWKQHWPFGEDLLNMIVDSRVIADRKGSYVFVRAPSNSGKGVFISVLKLLGIHSGFQSLEHYADNAKSSTSGLRPEDYSRAWVTVFDEFTKVIDKVKDLDVTISLTPKYGMAVEVAVYTKLFFSANHNHALESRCMTDQQYANRFSKLDIDADGTPITVRPLWNELSGTVYVSAMVEAFAAHMEARLQNYIDMGKHAAQVQGEAAVAAFHTKYAATKTIAKTVDFAAVARTDTAVFLDWALKGLTGGGNSKEYNNTATSLLKECFEAKAKAIGPNRYYTNPYSHTFQQLYREYCQLRSQNGGTTYTVLLDKLESIGKAVKDNAANTWRRKMPTPEGRKDLTWYEVNPDALRAQYEDADDDGDDTPPTGPGNGGGAPAPAPAPAAPAAPRPAVDPSVAEARAQAFGVQVAVKPVAAMPAPTLTAPAPATPAVAVVMEQVVIAHEPPVSVWQPPPVPALDSPAAPAPAGGVTTAQPASGTFDAPHKAVPPTPAPLPNEKRLKALGAFYQGAK